MAEYKLAIQRDLLTLSSTSITSVSNDTSNQFLIYDANINGCKYEPGQTNGQFNSAAIVYYAKLKSNPTIIYSDKQFVLYQDLSGKKGTVGMTEVISYGNLPD